MSEWVKRFGSSDFDPEYIKHVALGKLKERNKPMSSKGSIALAMQDLGRNKLNEAVEPILRSSVGAQLSMRDVLARMPTEEGKANFFIGLGGIMLGGIIAALEDCAAEGWDDNYLVSMLNRGLWGTPLPKLEQKDFDIKRFGYMPLTPDQQASLIRKTLKQDGGTFLGFFEPNTDNLPEGLRNYLNKTGNNYFIRCALPFYKAAINLKPTG